MGTPNAHAVECHCSYGENKDTNEQWITTRAKMCREHDFSFSINFYFPFYIYYFIITTCFLPHYNFWRALLWLLSLPLLPSAIAMYSPAISLYSLNFTQTQSCVCFGTYSRPEQTFSEYMLFGLNSVHFSRLTQSQSVAAMQATNRPQVAPQPS